MKNTRTIWMRVQLIQTSEIPFEVPADMPDSEAYARAEKKLWDRSPSERLGTNPNLAWKVDRAAR